MPPKFDFTGGFEMKAYAAANDPKRMMKTGSRLFGVLRHMKRDRQLLVLFMPCILFYIIFRYGPMYGVIIAFKKYSPFIGIIESPWVGFKYFIQFFTGNDFFLLLKNTFLLGFFNLIWTFPFPIIFALLLNELRNIKLKRIVQTVSYLPAFLSVVIVCSMLIDILSTQNGLINNIISALGFGKHYFIADPKWFRTIYIGSEIWSGFGIGAVLYIAAIAGIDPVIYEAGIIDGCNRFRAIWNITLPGIFPTMATMFILNAGNMFRVGFEKVFLLYTPTTYEVADVFSTYVYRRGINEGNYSFGAAVGLFESLVALILLLIANYASKKFSEQSLW